MILLKILMMTLPLATNYPLDLPADDSEFGYYYADFVTYALEDNHPMARLIVDRLAESVFQADSEKTLQNRLKLLKDSASDHPEFIKRFVSLDERMKKSFNSRVSKGKKTRLIYTAAGAVIGAVVAIPAGKLITSHTTLGNKVLYLAIPTGALLGAGAGFLLGQLLDMPKEMQADDFLSKDLKIILDEIPK